MHDGLKIAIGAGATALLAWTVHGPMGQGKAFVVGLEQGTMATLATRGMAGIKVHFPTSPYSRTASLSGDASLVEQDDALNLVRSLPGTSGAVWSREETSDSARATAGRAHETSQQIEERRAMELRNVLDDMAAPMPGEKKLAKVGTPTPTPTPTLTPTPKVMPVTKAAATVAPRPAPSPPPRAMSTPRPGPAPVQVATARPALAARPSANPCQRGIDAALAGRVMSFRSGSAWLNPQSNKMIDDVAAVLKRCRAYGIEIGGHTDGKGDEGVNRAMSQERANRVREALIARGVPARAILARGYGSGRPIRAGNTLDPANRRISFTISRGGV